MYEFLCSKRMNYYITKNLPFTALPWDLRHFKYWTGTLDFWIESGKNWDWSISFITTPCKQTKVHAHFLEELDVLFTWLATNLHPSMQLGDLSILQSDSLTFWLGMPIFSSDFWDPHRKRNSGFVFDSKDSGRIFFLKFRCLESQKIGIPICDIQNSGNFFVQELSTSYHC